MLFTYFKTARSSGDFVGRYDLRTELFSRQRLCSRDYFYTPELEVSVANEWELMLETSSLSADEKSCMELWSSDVAPR